MRDREGTPKDVSEAILLYTGAASLVSGLFKRILWIRDPRGLITPMGSRQILFELDTAKCMCHILEPKWAI